MKHAWIQTVWPLVFGSVLLTACGGGDSHEPSAQAPAPVAVPPEVTAVVPEEVSTSATAATQYVTSLSSQPEASTDGLEPVEVPEQIAQDDTAEPV
jgi:hypothetical protein